MHENNQAATAPYGYSRLPELRNRRLFFFAHFSVERSQTPMAHRGLGPGRLRGAVIEAGGQSGL